MECSDFERWFGRGRTAMLTFCLALFVGFHLPISTVYGQDQEEEVIPKIEVDEVPLPDVPLPDEGAIENGGDVVPDEKPIDKELQRKIRLLQRQLNSDATADRDKAEKAILEIGPKALDYLPNEDPTYSAEFNARLRKVRIGLELAVAESVVRPLSITLTGEYPLSDIATAFEAQTGNSVTLQTDATKKVNVDWDDKPFLAALDELLEIGSFAFQSRNGVIVLYSATENSSVRHVSYDQGFRTAAVSVRSFLNLDKNDLSTQLNVSLRWEPRLRLIRLSIPIEKIKIAPAGALDEDDSDDTDANGDEVDLEEVAEDGSGRRRNLEFGVSRGENSTFFDIPIKPQADGVKAVDIAGNFKALIAGRSEVFRFEDIAKGLENQTEIEKSGIKVKLEGRSDDEYLTGLKLTVAFADSKKSLESHFGWVYENPAYLIDPDGVRHEALTVESAGQNENQSSMLFLFDKLEDTKGWKLEYHSPGILVETIVPFRLHNIRLP